MHCRLVINLKLKEESSTAGNKVEHGVVKTKEKLVIVNHYFLEELRPQILLTEHLIYLKLEVFSSKYM